MTKKDYHEVLGVAKSASDEEIDCSYSVPLMITSKPNTVHSANTLC